MNDSGFNEGFFVATAHLAVSNTKIQRAANQQDIFIDGGECQNVVNSINLLQNEEDETHLRVNHHQSLSNRSIITFFDESNQSIAQEFRANESVIHLAPTTIPPAILEIQTTEPNQLYYELMAQQERFTIEEEDENLNNSTSQQTLGSNTGITVSALAKVNAL